MTHMAVVQQFLTVVCRENHNCVLEEAKGPETVNDTADLIILCSHLTAVQADYVILVFRFKAEIVSEKYDLGLNRLKPLPSGFRRS